MSDKPKDSGNPQPADVVLLEKERSKRWRTLLHRKGRAGAIKPILANALIALREAPEWKGALRYNAFSTTIVVEKRLPWHKGKWLAREWSGFDALKLSEWLQAQQIDVNKNTANDAAFAAAKECEFHPVRDWFLSLKWDGVERLDLWLPRYFKTPNRLYERTIGPRWVLSMVARIMQPGCKADCVLLLIGDQGQGKSSGLEAFVGKDWFTDEIGSLKGSRDTPIAMAGKLLVEFSDLEGFHGRSADELKAFISRTTDRFRAVFGQIAEDHPRQTIFAATTNQRTPLKDFTGNRRFWPVETGLIDLKTLRSDRAQLWAEAVHRFKSGEPWWLDTPELRALADEIAEERREIDELEVVVGKILDDKTEITMAEIIEEIYDKKPQELSRSEQIRIGHTLHALGWEKAERRRVGKVAREWLYKPQKPKSS